MKAADENHKYLRAIIFSMFAGWENIVENGANVSSKCLIFSTFLKAILKKMR